MITVKRSNAPAFTRRVLPGEPQSRSAVHHSDSRTVLAKNQSGKSKGLVGADGFSSLSTGIPTGAPNTTVSYNQITIDLDPMLQGITPQMERLLHPVYRDMYYMDAVAGSAVDLISNLPFSDFTLGGTQDQKVLKVYEEALERLNIRTLLPEINVDYLVHGAHISSLCYNAEKKVFTDIMPHASANCDIVPLPFYSQDPMITVRFPDEIKKALATDSKRVKRLRSMIGEKIIKQIEEGQIELDPLTSLYIPRRTFSDQAIGTSYFKRLLPIYLIEKNLQRGTLVESARRQRGIMHITAGDGETWDPTPQDLDAITEIFMNADSDPLGAIVTTKLGIAIEEIRQGGDFWKITDFADQALSLKLRALGISEAFLSGDANYNCVVGDTLITTNLGIYRIADMADRANGKVQNLNLKSASRFGKEDAAKWLYQGKAPTLAVGLDKAVGVSGTPKHRVLVLDGQKTDWKKLSDLRLGDQAAISLHKVVRKSRLKLNLKTVPKLAKNQHQTVLDKELSKPKYMTPDLAFVLGCITAEGCIQGTNIKMGNTNRALLDKYCQSFADVFNFDPTVKLAYAKGSEMSISGKTHTRNKDFHLTFTSRPGIVGWMKELGLSCKEGRKYGKTASYYKEVPWSVLQADVQSQLAFLAAYLECDGTVSVERNTVSFCSYSKTLLDQLYVMLTSMGLLARLGKHRVSLYGKDASRLIEALRPYLLGKGLDIVASESPRSAYGVPAPAFTEVLASAIIKSNNHETLIRTASGKELRVPKNALLLKAKVLSYDAYEGGQYDTFLKLLYLVDRSAYDNLLELFRLRYNFAEVVSVRSTGMKDVYDLSMRKGVEPSYNVNCIVGHNTADTSLTVFIDMIRAHREMMTRKLFYNKLFPLIAIVHGYTVNSKNKIVNKDLIGTLNGGELMDVLNDGSRLLIPSVHWSKQLKPEGDSAYMDMLQGMSEKGIPVPLRLMAAAAGLNLEEMLRQQDDDLETRKKIADYMKKIAELAPKDAEGGDDTSESNVLSTLASLDPSGNVRSAVHAIKGQKPSLFNRDFSSVSEAVGRTKTGKAKYIGRQKQHNEQINRQIVRAMKEAHRRGAYASQEVTLK